MKKPYIIGLGVVVLASVTTLGIKAAITKYPGTGDFMLFYCVGEMRPERLGIESHVLFWLSKVLFSLVLFSILYFGLKKCGKARLPIAAVFTVLTLISMSLGEAVVG